MKSAAWQRVALYGCLVAALVAAYMAPPNAADVALAPRVQALSDISHAANGAVTVVEARAASQLTNAPHLAEILPREDAAQAQDGWMVFGSASPLPTQAVAPRAATLPSAAAASAASPSSAASTSAAEPEAPPLPFRLLGQAQDGGQIRVFLQHGDQNLIVSTGDLIGRQYRVEHIDEQRVTFVYLPMNTVQHMALSPTSTETTK
jgi:hypothetical protein